MSGDLISILDMCIIRGMKPNLVKFQYIRS